MQGTGVTLSRGARRIAGPAARCLLVAAPLMFAACGANGGAAERLNQEGNRAYLAGDYQAAIDAYRRAYVERPDLTEIGYNLGNGLHRVAQYDAAVRESQKAAATGDNDTRFRAYYALGNHFTKQERWREAYESYRNALVLSPTDQDAKYNLEVVLKRMQAQEQERQQAKQQAGDQGQNQQGQGQQGQGQGGQQGQQSQGQGQGQGQQGQAGSGGQQDPAQQGQGGGQAQAGQNGRPGGGAGGPGQPTPGQPGQPGRSAAAVDQELKDTLAQFERGVSIEDALKILDLIAEEQRGRQSQIPGPPPGSNIRDQ